jgi:hypothetical protein
MKFIKRFKRWFKPGIITVTLMTILAILWRPSPATADSQGFPSTFLSLTNLPALLATGGSVSNQYVPLRITSGLGVQTIFQPTNSAATGTVTVVEYPSIDGSNEVNVAPFGTQIYTANGTNVIIGYTNWSQLQLKGITGLFFNITNSSGFYIYLNTGITNWANTNAPYPGGITLNRPNS